MRTRFVETEGNGRDGGGPKHDPSRREKTPMAAVRPGGVLGSFFSSWGRRRTCTTFGGEERTETGGVGTHNEKEKVWKWTRCRETRRFERMIQWRH